MKILTICPCCSNTMLYHISNYRGYWFCRSCWQKMPDLGEVISSRAIDQEPKYLFRQAKYNT